MQIKIFTIPVEDCEQGMEEMNRFLRTCKVADVRKELVVSQGAAYWTFCITYLQSEINAGAGDRQFKGKIDYKAVLSPEAFERFDTMRRIRREIAENDAIPPFAVFTDAELAQFTEVDDLTISAMKKLRGVGVKRVEKYGVRLCEALYNPNADNNEADGKLEGEDN